MTSIFVIFIPQKSYIWLHKHGLTTRKKDLFHAQDHQRSCIYWQMSKLLQICRDNQLFCKSESWELTSLKAVIIVWECRIQLALLSVDGSGSPSGHNKTKPVSSTSCSCISGVLLKTYACPELKSQEFAFASTTHSVPLIFLSVSK